MNNHHKSIIKLLLYYDIFDHMLSREEIMVNCCFQGESSKLPGLLEELTQQGFVYQINGYFAVRNDPSLLEKREKGSTSAARIMPKALKMARFITAFPFIRSVSLSGSLSKDYMYENGDVDFFIIARPERLWLARTLLVLYKKIFLLNSYKYFCLNYFVDEEHMEIEQENLFTATELFTLLPVTGRHYVKRLMEANPWVNRYYPQFPQRDIEEVDTERRGIIKRSLEWLLNNGLGNWLDRTAMKTTVKFWQKKYKDDPQDLFNKSFRLKRHIAKYHPENFQDLVLERFDERIKVFEQEKGINLNANF
jgi:hypothetical protein